MSLPEQWAGLSWVQIAERCSVIADRLIRGDLTAEDRELIGIDEKVALLPGALEARVAALLRDVDEAYKAWLDGQDAFERKHHIGKYSPLTAEDRAQLSARVAVLDKLADGQDVTTEELHAAGCPHEWESLDKLTMHANLLELHGLKARRFVQQMTAQDPPSE